MELFYYVDIPRGVVTLKVQTFSQIDKSLWGWHRYILTNTFTHLPSIRGSFDGKGYHLSMFELVHVEFPDLVCICKQSSDSKPQRVFDIFATPINCFILTY